VDTILWVRVDISEDRHGENAVRVTLCQVVKILLDGSDRGQHSAVTTHELEFGTQKKFILGRIPKSLAILTLFSNIRKCGDAVRLCASFKNGDCFMYEQGVIRPPSEARSILVRVTRNCPWNQCLFCPAYKGVKFSRRSVAEVKADIDAMAKEYGKHAEMIKTLSCKMPTALS